MPDIIFMPNIMALYYENARVSHLARVNLVESSPNKCQLMGILPTVATVYRIGYSIVMCQWGGVSNKPPGLRAVTRQGPNDPLAHSQVN